MIQDPTMSCRKALFGFSRTPTTSELNVNRYVGRFTLWLALTSILGSTAFAAETKIQTLSLAQIPAATTVEIRLPASAA